MGAGRRRCHLHGLRACRRQRARVHHEGRGLADEIRAFLGREHHGGCGSGGQQNIGRHVHGNEIGDHLDERMRVPQGGEPCAGDGGERVAWGGPVCFHEHFLGENPCLWTAGGRFRLFS